MAARLTVADRNREILKLRMGKQSDFEHDLILRRFFTKAEPCVTR
tara:strand:+ start:462 stop:596 length:135 start_codon:yes stop_codon:yes gene_type:complete